MALACRAVGIDRCVFATVFNLSRQARGMRTALAAADMAEVDARLQHAVAKPVALGASSASLTVQL